MPFRPCPSCKSELIYQDQNLLICPECGFEWDPAEVSSEETFTIKDANGVQLDQGGKITLVKDLKIKGSSQVLKNWYKSCY